MQPQCKVVCSVCGGAGMAWMYGFDMVHNDPEVCRTYLETRERRLRQREAELAKQAGGTDAAG